MVSSSLFEQQFRFQDNDLYLYYQILFRNIVTGEMSSIRKTCPCNIYPPDIEELGFAGIIGMYLIFLFLIQNIHCEYSLGPPRSNAYPQLMF